MKAQTYEFTVLLREMTSYFQCGYSKPADLVIARAVMATLKLSDNTVWKIEDEKNFMKTWRRKIFMLIEDLWHLLIAQKP